MYEERILFVSSCPCCKKIINKDIRIKVNFEVTEVPIKRIIGDIMLGCRNWMRDEDDVAAFRCGDKSNKGIELCENCKND